MRRLLRLAVIGFLATPLGAGLLRAEAPAPVPALRLGPRVPAWLRPGKAEPVNDVTATLVPAERSEPRLRLELDGVTTSVPRQGLLLDLVHAFSPDLERGPFLHTDDVHRDAIALDLRATVGWRATRRVRLEVGYGVAVKGEAGASALDVARTVFSDPEPRAFVRHGPWLGLRFDF